MADFVRIDPEMYASAQATSEEVPPQVKALDNKLHDVTDELGYIYDAKGGDGPFLDALSQVTEKVSYFTKVVDQLLTAHGDASKSAKDGMYGADGDSARAIEINGSQDTQNTNVQHINAG